MTIQSLQQRVDFLYQQGSISEATDLLLQGLNSEPNPSADYLSNLGYMLYLNDQSELAATHLQAALLIQADHPAALLNLGLVQQQNLEPEDAERTFRIAINADPLATQARCNLGGLIMQRGAVFEAIEIYHEALEIDDKSADLWSNLAMAWQEIADTSRASECFYRAWQLAPQRPELLSNWIMASLYNPTHNSTELREIAMQCHNEATSDEGYSASFVNHQSVAENVLHVGFLSADFRHHPVGSILRGLLPELLKQEVKVTLLNTGRKHDELTKRLRKLPGIDWLSLVGQSTIEALRKIRGKNLHVLVDLAGHTAGNRIDVLEQRVAPLQVGWLGYPGPCSYRNLDYALFGSQLLTQGSECYFSEALLSLKGSHFLFSEPDRAPEVVDPPVLRNKYITFGSFNNTAKLNEHTIRLWSQVLHAVTNSRLIIKWKSCQDPQFQQYLVSQFDHEGIDPMRIELRGASRHEEMLGEYGNIDIALDTWPFTGGMTSMEALWMGVPLITLYGLAPVSRQGYSLLSPLGLERFACTTEKAYVECAIELASNPQQLLNYRREFRPRMRHSALMDSEAYARAFVQSLRGAMA